MRVPFTFTRPGSGWVMGPQGIYVERGPDVPRYQWTPDGQSDGLLIERQATNYALHSNNLADSSWGKQGISAELINDPKFPFPISRIVGTAQTDNRRGVWAGLSAVDPYFAEVGVPSIRGFIIKAGTQRYIWIRTGSSSTGNDVRITSSQLLPLFDIQGGQYLGGSDDYRVEPLGDGWFFCYRIYVPGNSSQYTHGLGLVFVDEDGHNVTIEGTDLYVAGAVALKGDVAYSYTPTEGTPVTRPADSLYADMSLVPGFRSDRGTIVVEAKSFEAIGHILSLDDALTGPANRLFMTRTSAGDIRFQFRAQSDNSPYLWPGIPEFDVYRLAIAYDSHSARIRFNGDSPEYATTPTANAIQGLRYLRLYAGGHGLIRHVQYIPHAVSDAELQQLSSLNP